MFRKILLSYFPEIKNTELSPIHFHLKLLSSKLFYGISSKYWVENRRTIGLDTRFSYFVPYSIKIKESKDESFFYSYKNFASLNGFDNYNIYVIIPALLIIILKTYYKYFDKKDLPKFINPLLYSFNYLFVFFYARFKQYETDNDNLNLDFMISLLEKIIENLEKKNKNQEKLILELMKIIKKEPDLLMFIYKTTRFLESIYEWKKYHDIVFYDYLVTSSINNFDKDDIFLPSLNTSLKQIYLKRYTYYVSDDMIILSNIILWDRWYIWYLTNSHNIDFIPYFVNSLHHIDNIDFKKDIINIIDKTLNFKIWWNYYINALRNFNVDNIDINIDPSMKPEQVQELMSKETMDAVKKISNINEQFLDYYILLVSRKIDNNWDNLQLEFLNYESTFSLKQNNTFTFAKKYYENIRKKYMEFDKNYFSQSLFYKLKKPVVNLSLSYNFIDKLLNYEVCLASKKDILIDFSKKTHKECINKSNYTYLLKKSFQKDIFYIISSKDVKHDYLQKYYPWCFDDYNLTEKQINNFKENIYYPDFITYFKFLKFTRKKFKEEELILASRFKETLFWYIILQHTIWYSSNIEVLYLSWLNLYKKKISIDLKKFYEYFIKFNKEFIEIFSNVSQNKKFIDISLSILDKIDKKDIYIYDTLRDITYYNKRTFKI